MNWPKVLRHFDHGQGSWTPLVKRLRFQPSPSTAPSPPPNLPDRVLPEYPSHAGAKYAVELHPFPRGDAAGLLWSPLDNALVDWWPVPRGGIQIHQFCINETAAKNGSLVKSCAKKDPFLREKCGQGDLL